MSERATPSPEHLREASARIPVFNVHELEGDPRYVFAEGPRTSHSGGIGIVLETYVEYRLYKFSDQYKSPSRMGVEGVDLKVTEKRVYGDRVLESDI